MVSVRELSAQSKTRQMAIYYQALDARDMAIASNPALIGVPVGQSPETRELLLATPDGGQVRARYIGNSSIGNDRPVPALVRNGAQGFADTRSV